MAEARTRKHPIEKVALATEQLSSAMSALLAGDDDGGLIEGMKAYRRAVSETKGKGPTVNPAAQEILKILGKYNEEFSKLILTVVRSKTGELKQFGALSRFEMRSPGVADSAN